MHRWMLHSLALGACLVTGPASMAADGRKPNEEYVGDFNYGQSNKAGGEWVQSIRILSPAYRSEIRGEVTVRFTAPGMTRAQALCWQQPTRADPNPWGHDEEVMPMTSLDEQCNGSFVFGADRFPNGPIALRINAHDGVGRRDTCELQLYNTGGVVWNQGIPATAPRGAAGMRLVFADDFGGELSISGRGDGARYSAHKPRFGDFSGWRFSHPADFEGAHNPFSIVGTFLRIHARKYGPGRRECGTGLISSARFDGTGVWARAPCYFECRFTAQSAPGTWPAFWTLTAMDQGVPGDELDIIEGYGGVGRKNPNHPTYSIVTHFWRQTTPDGKKMRGYSARPPITELGGRSYWSTTFHTYAVKVTAEETTYYFDGFEVLRHPSGPISASRPMFFLVNYAIGGISGWQIDLERYANATDMWVDYVRVYQGGGIDLADFRLSAP